MSAVVKLSDELMSQAKHYASVYHRSVPKQIEYWSRIGKIAEENPDLPYNFIKDVLLALDEERSDQLEEYSFTQ
jgi:hypothetical protein